MLNFTSGFSIGVSFVSIYPTITLSLKRLEIDKRPQIRKFELSNCVRCFPQDTFSLDNFLRFNVKFCGKFPISEKKKIGRILIKNSWNLKVALSKIYIFIITLSTHDKLVHYFIWFQTIPFILSLVYLRWEFFLYPRLTENILCRPDKH